MRFGTEGSWFQTLLSTAVGRWQTSQWYCQICKLGDRNILLILLSKTASRQAILAALHSKKKPCIDMPCIWQLLNAVCAPRGTYLPDTAHVSASFGLVAFAVNHRFTGRNMCPNSHHFTSPITPMHSRTKCLDCIDDAEYSILVELTVLTSYTDCLQYFIFYGSISIQYT